MNDIEKLCGSSLEEIKRGYTEETEQYVCLLCGAKTDKGTIYQNDGVFCDAQKSMKLHIKLVHKSVFDYLIQLDKKMTGISEHQSKLMTLFFEGKNDSEVQKDMGVGSSSTIRNHRFVLKEKERQAKIFLVLMELLREGDIRSNKLVEPHKTATMVDGRYKVTHDEQDKTLEKYFPQGLNGKIKTFSMKEKSKLVVLKHIATKFDENSTYTEKEVNEILKAIHDDFATVRRYLIEYGFLDRKADGSKYWLKDSTSIKTIKDRAESAKKESEVSRKTNSEVVKEMDRKKELVQQYKEMDNEGGIYQIRNTQNNKILLECTQNLKTINGKVFQLKMGSHRNKFLQEEWSKYGEDSFVFEILEVLKEKKEGYFDKKEELKKLEEKWLQKLNPYGDKGYNVEKKSNV